MRIAITGTHGVGKTTLAEVLSKALHLPLINEVAREVAIACGYKSTEEIFADSPERKAFFQITVMGAQSAREFAVRTRGFVSDRSILDIIAYMRLYELENIKPDLDTLTENAIDYAATNYDLVIYLPLADDDRPVADDGFRLTDKESQEKVDKWISMMVDRLPNAKIITENTFKKRVTVALSAVADIAIREWGEEKNEQPEPDDED